MVKNLPANAGNARDCRFDPWVGKIPWRRAWQPNPVFLPGESHGQRSVVGYSSQVAESLIRLKQLSTHTEAVWADLLTYMGFPGGLAGKESACNAGDLGSIYGLGRSSGEGKGYPLQYSGLENSLECIAHGVAKSRTQLSDFHLMFILGVNVYIPQTSSPCSAWWRAGGAVPPPFQVQPLFWDPVPSGTLGLLLSFMSLSSPFPLHSSYRKAEKYPGMSILRNKVTFLFSFLMLTAPYLPPTQQTKLLNLLNMHHS